MNQQHNVKRPITFAALAMSLTLSTVFFPVDAKAAKAEANTCLNMNKVSIAVPKSIDSSKLDATLVARARRRLRVVHYYSDSSFTTRVGSGTFRCDGSSTLTGRSTQFSKEVLNEPCCGSVPC